MKCCRSCKRPFTEEELEAKKKQKSLKITLARTSFDPTIIRRLYEEGKTIDQIKTIMGCRSTETIYRALSFSAANPNAPRDTDLMRTARAALDERLQRAIEKRKGK